MEALLNRGTKFLLVSKIAIFWQNYEFGGKIIRKRGKNNNSYNVLLFLLVETTQIFFMVIV